MSNRDINQHYPDIEEINNRIGDNVLIITQNGKSISMTLERVQAHPLALKGVYNSKLAPFIGYTAILSASEDENFIDGQFILEFSDGFSLGSAWISRVASTPGSQSLYQLIVS
jgi:hypothetical protein